MRKIEFVKYVPLSEFSYCNGDLHLLVDGKEWSGTDVLYHTFGCEFDENWNEVFYDGTWELIDEKLNEFSDSEKDAIRRLVNENIEAHCCGGCL